VIFPDTEDLRGRVDELVANLPTELSVIEGVRRALQTISHEFEDSKDLQLARARLVESTPSLQTLVLHHEEEWVHSFANAVADRLGLDPDEDLRPELTAAVVVAAFRAVMNRWIKSGGKADVDQMLDQALVFLGSGLGSSDFD
jgi:MftR C-terminal domain